MARPRGTGRRGEQTRAKILETAEGFFGERGFAETRLEDVAEAVGVRRAALLYYFADKQELYRAVLEDVFGGLVRHMVAASEADADPAKRIEAMAGAWVTYVAQRPATARLYLREIANAGPGRPAAIAEYLRAVYDHGNAIIRRGERLGALRRVDTVQLINMVAGATLMFTAGAPASGMPPSYNPLRRREMATHREQILRMTRGLLGAGEPGGATSKKPKKVMSRRRTRAD